MRFVLVLSVFLVGCPGGVSQEQIRVCDELCDANGGIESVYNATFFGCGAGEFSCRCANGLSDVIE